MSIIEIYIYASKHTSIQWQIEVQLLKNKNIKDTKVLLINTLSNEHMGKVKNIKICKKISS